MKLAGSSWGANANTLRSSVLCYSVAEYCCHRRRHGFEVEGHKLRRKAPEIFFSVLSPICVVPPNPGAQRGHTIVENRHCENNTSLKKQGTVDLATGP